MPNPAKLRSWLVAAALLWMALNNGLVLWNTRVRMLQGYGDFASFYTAGTLVRRGLATDLYNPSAQWKVQQEFAPQVQTRLGPLPYIRPPFEALFFAIFASWTYAKAFLIWTSVKLALLTAIPLLVVRDRPWAEPFPPWTAGILILGTFPEFMDLLMGQDAALLTFMFALAFWQLAKGNDRAAGAILGLALFKFQLVIPVVIILWIAGRKRILPGFALTASAAVAVSAVLVGFRGLLHYAHYLIALNQATGVGVIMPEGQMNLRGLLVFFVGHSPYPGRIHWILAPIALAAMIATGLLWRNANARANDLFLDEGFGLALVTAIVTSYYAYDYDLLLLVVPLLAMRAHSAAESARPDTIARYLQAGALLLLLLTPLYWFTRQQLHAECLMALPVLALGIAWARQLRHAGTPLSARILANEPANEPTGGIR
jgi:hypothetical protein